MKRLTAILCLTLALLLGSAGEGWSADSEELAYEYVESREWVEGVNNVEQENEFFVGIGTGNTLPEAFCDVVINTTVILSAHLKSEVSNDLQDDETFSEGTYRSRYKIKGSGKSNCRTEEKSLEVCASYSKISIKSPKAHLSCERIQESTMSQTTDDYKTQFQFKFDGNNLDFRNLFAEFQTDGQMRVFFGEEESNTIRPDFSIVFASQSRNWRK